MEINPKEIIQKIENDYGVSLKKPRSILNENTFARKVAVVVLRDRLKLPLKSIFGLTGYGSTGSVFRCYQSAIKEIDVVEVANSLIPREKGIYNVRFNNRDTVAEFNGVTWLILGSADQYHERDFERIFDIVKNL